MKAILVIDEPVMCINCPCFKYQLDETGICCAAVNAERAYGLDMYSKPTWCRAKPLPNKISPTDIFRKNLNGLTFVDGWNACIEEILGGNQ